MRSLTQLREVWSSLIELTAPNPQIFLQRQMDTLVPPIPQMAVSSRIQNSLSKESKEGRQARSRFSASIKYL